MFLWTVMCKETMEIKPKPHLKTDCLRRTMYPRLGLRLLRVVSLERDSTGAGHWRSSSVKIKRYLHKEKRLAKRAKTTEIDEDIFDTQCEGEYYEDGGASRLPPPGAMAPANTTQYLMDKIYEDLQQRPDTVPPPPHREEQLDTPESSYDACLLFQQRDFDTHYGALWR